MKFVFPKPLNFGYRINPLSDQNPGTEWKKMPEHSSYVQEDSAPDLGTSDSDARSLLHAQVRTVQDRLLSNQSSLNLEVTEVSKDIERINQQLRIALEKRSLRKNSPVSTNEDSLSAQRKDEEIARLQLELQEQRNSKPVIDYDAIVRQKEEELYNLRAKFAETERMYQRELTEAHEDISFVRQQIQQELLPSVRKLNEEEASSHNISDSSEGELVVSEDDRLDTQSDQPEFKAFTSDTGSLSAGSNSNAFSTTTL